MALSICIGLKKDKEFFIYGINLCFNADRSGKGEIYFLVQAADQRRIIFFPPIKILTVPPLCGAFWLYSVLPRCLQMFLVEIIRIKRKIFQAAEYFHKESEYHVAKKQPFDVDRGCCFVFSAP